jgi:tripartite-type tricarboxylate transporter receptor subunit TctC
LGISAYASTPAEFAALIASETAKWGKVIRDAGIKAE